MPLDYIIPICASMLVLLIMGYRQFGIGEIWGNREIWVSGGQLPALVRQFDGRWTRYLPTNPPTECPRTIEVRDAITGELLLIYYGLVAFKVKRKDIRWGDHKVPAA